MVTYRKAKKYVKGVARRTKKVVRKRYSGKSGISNLVHDVSLLKQIINVEKKYFSTTDQGIFSQLNSTGTYPGGISYANISPQIPVGDTVSHRNGNSVKLTGGLLQLQIKQQSTTSSVLYYKCFVVLRQECYQPASAASVGQSMFEQNPFSPGAHCLDYHSQRNINTMSQYKILRVIKGKLMPDEISLQTSASQLAIPFKFNMHLRYNDSTTNLPVTNNIYLVFLADSGNSSANTGATWAHNMKFFYVDN